MAMTNKWLASPILSIKIFAKISLINGILLSNITLADNPVAIRPSQDKAKTTAFAYQAKALVSKMTDEQKIAQKLMLDFRYWNDGATCLSSAGLTTFNDDIKNLVQKQQIGGVILFSENIVTIDQTRSLIDAFQTAASQNGNLPLLIGIDHEGGKVNRLPRAQVTNFPGNMAITAASLGNPDVNYAYKVGEILATELAYIGFNVNFAPVVDVNSNPLNPVINIRSLGDKPSLVSQYGKEIVRGIQSQGVCATLKHFPGHGNTTTDSHTTLPLVQSDYKTAMHNDIAPFRNIIKESNPDMLMTAHIQYPSLDSTMVRSKTGEFIVTPATFSRKIQHDMLRGQLGFKKIIISDALDMGGIADFFEPVDAAIKVFQAGVDIALMPLAICTADDVKRLSSFITDIKLAVATGAISKKELDASVQRIIELKLSKADKKALLTPVEPGNLSHKAFEEKISTDAITLVKNKKNILPLKFCGKETVHIITPLLEQGAAIEKRFEELRLECGIPAGIKITRSTIEGYAWEAEKEKIRAADILIAGTMAIAPYPNESGKAQSESPLSPERYISKAFTFAGDMGKKTIYLSLRSPNDLAYFAHSADAILALYNYFGYNSANDSWNSLSLHALTDIVVGKKDPKGKLPIDIFSIADDGAVDKKIYARGFGLRYPTGQGSCPRSYQDIENLLRGTCPQAKKQSISTRSVSKVLPHI